LCAAGLGGRMSAAGLGHGMPAAGLTCRMSAARLTQRLRATGLTGRMSAARLTQRLTAIGLAGGVSGPGLSRRLGCVPGPGVATTGLAGGGSGPGLTGITRFCATCGAWTRGCGAPFGVVVFAIWHGLERKTFGRRFTYLDRGRSGCF
jgi:hypothetical protein